MFRKKEKQQTLREQFWEAVRDFNASKSRLDEISPKDEKAITASLHQISADQIRIEMLYRKAKEAFLCFGMA